MIEEDNTLFKARRNLLTTTIILLLIQFAGISIDKSIRTSYATINIENPDVIIYGIFALHIYFLIRFIQILPSETLSLSKIFYKKQLEYLASVIYKKVIDHDKSVNDFYHDLHELHNPQDAQYEEMQKEEFLSYSEIPKNVAEDILSEHIKKKIYIGDL